MNLSELNWEHFIIPFLVVAAAVAILEFSGTGGVWVEPTPGTTVQELASQQKELITWALFMSALTALGFIVWSVEGD